MTVFSTFGIYDNEIHELICQLSKNNKLSQKALQNWFYFEGIHIFLKTQEDENEVYEAQCRCKPNISTDQMIYYKRRGFEALLQALINKFAQSDLPLKMLIESLYLPFMKRTIENHFNFYEIQAIIASALNQRLNTNPNTSMGEIQSFVKNELLTHKKYYPALSNDIDANISHINQIVASMQNPLYSINVTSLFRPKTAITRLPPHNSDSKNSRCVII